MKATAVRVWSATEFRFTAWKMPSGKAIRTASVNETPDSQALCPMFSPRRESTDWLSL